MKTIINDISSRHNFMKGRGLIENRIPWLAFGAIFEVEKILHELSGRADVLELGAGGSTLFFETRARSVLSLESEPEWAEMVRSKLTNGVVDLRVVDFKGFIRTLKQCPHRYYDMVLIDCFSGNGTYKKRQVLLDMIAVNIKKGGWLIIDNYRHVSFEYSGGWDVYTFDMMGYSGRGTRLLKKL